MNVTRTRALLINLQQCSNCEFFSTATENYQDAKKLTQKLSRGLTTWRDLRKSALIFIVSWQTKRRSSCTRFQRLSWMSQLQEGAGNSDRRFARLVTFVHLWKDYRQLCDVGNTAQHCRLFCSKTQILLKTLRTRNQSSGRSYVHLEVQHVSPKVGCARNKRRCPTVLRPLKTRNRPQGEVKCIFVSHWRTHCVEMARDCSRASTFSTSAPRITSTLHIMHVALSCLNKVTFQPDITVKSIYFHDNGNGQHQAASQHVSRVLKTLRLHSHSCISCLVATSWPPWSSSYFSWLAGDGIRCNWRRSTRRWLVWSDGRTVPA